MLPKFQICLHPNARKDAKRNYKIFQHAQKTRKHLRKKPEHLNALRFLHFEEHTIGALMYVFDFLIFTFFNANRFLHKYCQVTK